MGDDMTKEQLLAALEAERAKNKELEAELDKREPKAARKSFSVRQSRADRFDVLARAAGVSGSVLFESWIDEKYAEYEREHGGGQA